MICHTPGFVADVMGLLANADILISPSRTECMPNSVLEAMWARVPVAATDVGGVGEMVRHEAEALLCPPPDPLCDGPPYFQNPGIKLCVSHCRRDSDCLG